MRLKAARERSGKTQAQVARETGIPEQAYQRYEYGSREPRVSTAIKIADALDVDVKEIFSGEGETESLYHNDKSKSRN